MKMPRPVPENAPILRVGDVAQLLDCSTQQVRLLTRAGRIAGAFRIGRLIRFRRAEFTAWLTEQMIANRNPASLSTR